LWVGTAEGLARGLGVCLGFRFGKGEVDMIDLDGCVDKFFEGIDIANEGEGALNIRLQPISEQSETGFIVDAKNIGGTFEFSSELGSKAGLFEFVTQVLMTLLVSIHRSQFVFVCVVIMEEIGGRLNKGVTPFCRRSTAMGDYVGNFDIIAVERNGTHSEVEVTVVDECSVFRRLAIEFRGFGKFGFFAYGSRTWRPT